MFAARIVELADADIADLDAVLAAAKRKRDEADLEIAAVTAVVDSRQLFHEHAQSSIKAYLKQQLNCSGPDALRIKRRARLFNQHPEIADVFGDSRIAVGQVDVMASAQQHPRAGDQFADFAGLFLGQAERLEHDDFADAINILWYRPIKTARTPIKSFMKTSGTRRCVSMMVLCGYTPREAIRCGQLR